jgi:hypothetical protein
MWPPSSRQRERRFRVCMEAPGFRPGPRHERRFRVYEEAPGFRLGPRHEMHAAVCVMRHQAFALAPSPLCLFPPLIHHFLDPTSLIQLIFYG